MEDLGNDLARIQVCLDTLGLEWESQRVQVWLEKAGAWYLRDCLERGVRPERKPPYPSLMWLPDVLVKKLAAALWKEVGANGHSPVQQEREVSDGDSGQSAGKPG